MAALIEDRIGRLWLGNLGGGVYYAETSGNWKPVAGEGPLVHSAVTCLFEDREGLIWIGTQGGGLHCVRPNLATALTLPPEAQDYVLQSVCPSRNRGVWAGTDGRGVYLFRNGEFTQVGKNEDFANLHVYMMLEDRQTNVWIGSSGGFWRLNGTVIEAVMDPGQPFRNLQAIFEDNTGRLWVGMRPRLAFRTGDAWQSLIAASPQKPADVRAIVEDQAGRVWVASCGSGLYRFRGDRVEFFGAKHSPALTTACALLTDQAGRLWVGSGAGLLRLDGETLTGWTMEDGLPSNEIIALAEDQNGVLWMSSTRGIYGCSFVEFEARARDRGPRILCRQLGPPDGLASLACSGIPTAWLPIFGSEFALDPSLGPEESRQHTQAIGARARELVAALDEIVWAVNPKNDTVASLASYLSHYAERFLMPTRLRLRRKVARDLPSTPLNAEERYNLFLASKEALHNVVQHSKATEVQLTIGVEHDVLTVVVADNGSGFNPGKSRSEADGLGNMRRRLEQIGGSHELVTVEDKGTTATFNLPFPETKGVSLEQMQKQLGIE